ncbi:MAG: class I SAM-dependent methyltransferase [Candidatus Omnitrophica bacterium]|nr:class I SAM-dependent methyltransferase [Candidatus Omnitrophota bacterium]
MNQNLKSVKQTWEDSFKEQIAQGAYNTAPVEAIVRNVAYYLRNFDLSRVHAMHFLEMGSGAGPNLVWLAEKGIRVSGVDISSQALQLCRANLQHHGFSSQIGELVEASVENTIFQSQYFDGIVESCVFQHLDKQTREKSFQEVRRLLKPGGVFVGYMLSTEHTVFQKNQKAQDPQDSGTLQLEAGGSKVYLTNIGLAHFFEREELLALLKGFSVIDLCRASYELPKLEAQKRGYENYLQGMWIVYAIR